MMIFDAPLLAADDNFKILAVIVALIFYAIKYLLTNDNKAKPNGKKKPQQRPTTQRPPRPPQPVAGSPQLQNEIEQFLKRASDRRRDKKREPVADARPQSGQRQPQRRLVETPLDVEVLESDREDSVSEHVRKRLSTAEFSSRAAHMTDDMSRADREREQHMKRTFNHQLGKLSTTPTDGTVSDAGGESHKATDNAPATQLAALSAAAAVPILLSQPENLRQAVILNEILRRPEHRW